MQHEQPDSLPRKKLFQISQKALLYRPEDKTFLFLKVANVSGNFYRNYGPWDIPGGRVDGDEDATEALKREIREELGPAVRYTFDLDMQPLGRMEMEYTAATVMNIGFLAEYQDGEITLSQEHSAYRFATVAEVEKDEDFKPWLKQFVKVAEARLKGQAYLDHWKRTQAEFENYKKRQAVSQKELGGYLIEKLVLDIIPILDNFRQATLHVPEDQQNNSWVTGIQYIEKQLETVLTDNGMRTIEAKEGDMFDPKIHEAVDREQETMNNEQETEKKQIVTRIIQKGYQLGDKVIRAARVVVK